MTAEDDKKYRLLAKPVEQYKRLDYLHLCDPLAASPPLFSVNDPSVPDKRRRQQAGLNVSFAPLVLLSPFLFVVFHSSRNHPANSGENTRATAMGLSCEPGYVLLVTFDW